MRAWCRRHIHGLDIDRWTLIEVRHDDRTAAQTLGSQVRERLGVARYRVGDRNQFELLPSGRLELGESVR